MENLNLVLLALHRYTASILKDTPFESIIDIDKQILIGGSEEHSNFIKRESESPGDVKLPILTLILGNTNSQDFELGEADGRVSFIVRMLIQADTVRQELYLSDLLRRSFNRTNINVLNEYLYNKPVLDSIETGLTRSDKIYNYGSVVRSERHQSIIEFEVNMDGSKFL